MNLEQDFGIDQKLQKKILQQKSQNIKKQQNQRSDLITKQALSYYQDQIMTFPCSSIPKLAVVLTLILLYSCQPYQHHQNQRPQPIRSIVSNLLSQKHQIMIAIKVFNSTHQIFKDTHNTTYSSQLSQKILPIDVQIFNNMDNITIEVKFAYQDIDSSQFVQVWTGYASNFLFIKLDLTKFKKITKVSNEEFFASGEVGSSNRNQKGNYTLHIAEDFNIMIIYSQMILPGKQIELLKKINFTMTNFQFNGLQNEAKYLPRLDISQMHVPFKYYKPINGLLQQNITQTSNNRLNLIKNHTIQLRIYPYDLMRYAVFFQMFDPSARQEAMQINPLMQFMVDEQAYDDMKELLFTNNLYIVALTMIMTFAKTILEIFALKNQFKIWNQIQKNKGLSIKVLYTDLAFQIVFLLYLLDNESNLLMTVPLAINILVVLWKLKKTINIQKTNQFPFYKLRHHDWCRHNEKIDSQGVTYMYYGLIGLFVIYLGYQIFTSSSAMQILSYSGILEKMVFFMGMAGFIRMTPQIYINYKLKSVDHLPWRSLIYRFMETVIDDFYVFLVTTPLLHKVMVFREDVIFLLYIYQRIIYKTDPNRIGTAGGMVLEKAQVEQIQNSLKLDKRGKNQ